MYRKNVEKKVEALRERLLDEINKLFEDEDSRPVVSSPYAAAGVFIPLLSGLRREEFWVATLNTKHRVMGLHRLYVGTINLVHIRIAEVFRPAVEQNALAILIAHNHPSGDPSPSQEDVELTRKIRLAGEILEVELIDHIIIGSPRQWVSLRERKLGF